MTTKDKGITLPAFSSAYQSFGSGGIVTSDTANNYVTRASWIYGPGFITPANNVVPGSVAPLDYTIRGQDAAGAFASVGGYLYLKPGVGSAGNVSGLINIQDTAGAGGTWNSAHLMYSSGANQIHQWFDANSRIRIKTGAVPANATDGIQVLSADFTGSAVYDPANLADGVGVTTTVAAAGAALGDFALVSFSLDLQGILLTAYVSGANVVSVRFQNESGGAIDLASGTVRVKVIKQ